MEPMKFKDVAHLYLGCLVIDSDGKGGKLLGLKDRDSYGSYALTNCKTNMGYWSLLNKFKPILRPLSDMTEEETRFIYRHIHYSELSYEWRNAIAHLQQRITDGALMVNAELFRYLLSKHFDLFNLIESKEAIDSTTNAKPDLTTNPLSNG